MNKKTLLPLLFLLPFTASAAIQVNVSPTTLFTNEDGSPATYQLVLDEAPSAGETVTVNIASGDVTEGTVGVGSVMFTDADWDVPQSIAVTPGSSGDGNDGDVAFTITHNVTAAGGTASFNGAPASNVGSTNRNIDGISTIIMDPASGGAFFLDEGSSQTVTISATGGPASDISVDVSIAGVEATVSIPTVVLNAGNGFSATFDVTAVADAVVDADQPFTVVTAAAVSADGNYNGQNLNDIDGVAINVDVAPPALPTQSIPTMSVLWQMALAAGLLLVAGFSMRRFT